MTPAQNIAALFAIYAGPFLFLFLARLTGFAVFYVLVGPSALLGVWLASRFHNGRKK